MISTDCEAATGVLENDEQLVNELLRSHNIDSEQDLQENQTPTYSNEDEEDLDIYDKSEWDKYDTIERQLYPSRSRGYKNTLKYTINVNKSKNLYRLVTVNPAAECKSESKNFRRFGLSAKNKQKEENSNEKTTNSPISSKCEKSVDEYTLCIIQKMIDNQLLKKVNYLLEVEPRWYIFHANCNLSHPINLDSATIPSNLPEDCMLNSATIPSNLPEDCMIKIFKEDVENVKSSNETIHIWVEKEWTNLSYAWEIIPCPQPIYYKGHVVVTSFIGTNRKLAPKIKFVKLKREEYATIYHEIVESMKVLYTKANVIHGNLSEYSILWHNRKCYFVDFDQSLRPHEEGAFDALYKDCANITKYFRDLNIPDMYTTKRLFQIITGYGYKDKVNLAKVAQAFQSKELALKNSGQAQNVNIGT